MHELNSNIHFDFPLDPLIDAIRNNKGVVYVGAGASKSAGFPDWVTFLKQCLEIAKDSYQRNRYGSTSSNEGFELVEKLLNNGDYLMAAELLQQQVGTTLKKFITDTFGAQKKSSAIHEAIARIPFALAITTNYDKLLESAYGQIPDVFTWRDPEAIFESIKNNRFAVIKTHGDVANSRSVVLTKTHYRDLIHRNKAFSDQMLALLSLDTFLFVGSSLRDHDLLNLMDVAKLTYGSNFGPHYAFLFSDEVDNAFVRYLKDAYNINVIVSSAQNENKTESVSSFLKILSGRIFETRVYQSHTLTINSELFCFNKMVQKQLKSILVQTGAERGTVAFIDRRDLPGLKYFIRQNIYDDKFQKITILDASKSAKTNSSRKVLLFEKLLKECYYKGGNVQKHIYYPDISADNNSKVDTDITNWEFTFSDDIYLDDTRSVLMTQVHSDGQLIGAIMIKSSVADAFTKDHVSSLNAGTVFLAAIFKELELRNFPLLEIDLANNTTEFQRLMDNSSVLRDYDLSYLFYEIDHRNGRLIAHYDPTKVARSSGYDQQEPFIYDFMDNSLATHMLTSQQQTYYSDVKIGVKEDVISSVGVREFGIKGEIFATPIRVGNYNSFILVAWSRRQKTARSAGSLKKVTTSISRLAHLIANSTDRTQNNSLAGNNKAKAFIDSVNKQLEQIDDRWSYNFLKIEENRTKLYAALMGVLNQEDCNLGRVRLWLYNEAANNFSCIYSINQQSATKEGKEQVNEFVKVPPTPADNDYCRYTLNRFSENPHAMHQHVSMFPGPDPNTKELDKDPEGKWIVGPIVSRTPKQKKGHSRLLGFISADNHFINNGVPKDRILTGREDAFQRYAVDSISDLIAPILHIHALALQKKNWVNNKAPNGAEKEK